MHVSVLLNESIDGLNIKEDGTYVDATLGYAGHSSEILKRIKKGFLFAIDQDKDAIKASKEKLSKLGSNFTIINASFILHLKNSKICCIIQILQNNDIITIVLNVYYNLVSYIDISGKKYKI